MELIIVLVWCCVARGALALHIPPPWYQSIYNINFSDVTPVRFLHRQKIFHPSPEHGELAYSSAAFSLGAPGDKGLGTILSGAYLPQLPHSPGNSVGAAPLCQPSALGHCTKTQYRTMDGSCNNLQRPDQGAANTQYARLLPPRYADGIHLPRVSESGHALPGSRLLSNLLFPEHPINDPVWTLDAMQWGQVITHDMSMAMGTTQTKPLGNQCCSPDGQLQMALGQDPNQCYPIVIPRGDPWYSKLGISCLTFGRSTTNVDRGCAPPNKPHEQLVTVSHYMDASLVYGSSQQMSDSLRQGFGGRLLVEVRHGRQWPPSAHNRTALCDTMSDSEVCYRFGDVRGNQNTELTVLQILLLREHNRLADVLQDLNQHWSDERVFQEARRILIAEYQHINYYEWLPIFLGWSNMEKYGLVYRTEGYVDDYKEDVDASVLNSHATAAFRYFHSAIQGHLELVGEDRQIQGVLRLSDHFNRPGVIEKGSNLDHLARGLSSQSQEAVDPHFTGEITRSLFRNGRALGRDLRAIGIQRGRDHGLATYNEFRHFCGLPRARRWADFTDLISPQNVERLSAVYESREDVDIGVGGFLERHVDGTLTGPTFLCIMLEQFYRTRVGDRFFYESTHAGFTPEQLGEIRKATVSRIVCDNGDSIRSMQPEGFRIISDKNPLVSCGDTGAIPALDLKFWREHPTKGASLEQNKPVPFVENYHEEFYVYK